MAWARSQVHFPITVRDAQRLVSRRAISLHSIAKAIGVEPDRYLVLAQLARLAAKDPHQVIFDAGANPPSDAQLLPEEQGQKGDSQDSLNNIDAQPHGQGSGNPQADGGEGASQDCSENGRNDRSDTSEGHGAPENTRSPAHRLDVPPSTALGGNDRVSGNTDISEGDQPRDAGAQESSDSLPTAPEDDRAGDTEPIETGSEEDQAEKPADDRPAHQKKWGKKFSRQERAGGQLSATGKDSHGGITAKLDKVAVDRTLVQLCRARLGALVGDNCQNPSPRRDYTEFCTRLKTYRNPAPARKEEEGRPVILIMADVSGSCSSFADEALRVAKATSALGVAGADVLTIAHSNGYPEQMELNGKPIGIGRVDDDADDDPDAPLVEWYQRLLRRYPIEVVIAIGDWDAMAVYEYLVHQPIVSRLIWLDQAKARLGVRDCTPMVLTEFKKTDGIRHKVVYRQGCKDAKQFVQNIK